MHWTKIRSGASICKKPNQEVTVLLPGCLFEKVKRLMDATFKNRVLFPESIEYFIVGPLSVVFRFLNFICSVSVPGCVLYQMI